MERNSRLITRDLPLRLIKKYKLLRREEKRIKMREKKRERKRSIQMNVRVPEMDVESNERA